MPPHPSMPSPCVGVCRLDADGVCVGCGRLIEEIAAWPAADESQRRQIAEAAARRRRTRTAAVARRKPGRRGDLP
ncbi:MAG: DUF1289 domain-containing protein [Gammaproteobacteria bacterium]|nr:DUF1289 domain-containing protein [Gammaproteobacteria bacterium]